MKHKKRTMKNTSFKTQNEIGKDEFVLVKGEFSPENALEIINHLVTQKISFHKLRSFSSEIRFGHVDEPSSIRIEELRICKESLKQIIHKAKMDGKKLALYSTIRIQII